MRKDLIVPMQLPDSYQKLVVCSGSGQENVFNVLFLCAEVTVVSGFFSIVKLLACSFNQTAGLLVLGSLVVFIICFIIGLIWLPSMVLIF